MTSVLHCNNEHAFQHKPGACDDSLLHGGSMQVLMNRLLFPLSFSAANVHGASCIQ